MRAVGEDEGIVLHPEMARHHEFRLEIHRQLVPAVVADARQLGEADALVAALLHDLAVDDVELRRAGLQDHRADFEDVLLQREPGQQHRLAADPGRARGPGAAAVGHLVGVAGEHFHAAHLDADGGRRDLRHNGVGALTLLGDAGRGDDRAVGVQLDRAAVLRRDPRAADAVEHRARVGDLDERRQADAAVDAFLAQLRLLPAQLVVLHQAEQFCEALLVRERFEPHSRGRLVRVGVVGDDVALSHLRRVDAEFRRSLVDHVLGDRDGDGMPDRAVLAHHRLVLEHDRAFRAVLPVLVRAAGEVQHLVAFDARGPREHRVRADAGEVVDLQREHVAVAIHRELRPDAVGARVDVGDEGLEAVGGELHRPPEHERERAGGDLVAVGVDLDAERAADVARDDAHAVLVERQPAGDDPLHHVRRLPAVVHRHRFVGAVVVGEDRARLQGDAGVAAELERVLDDEVRGLHRGVDAARVDAALEAQVAVEFRVDLRRGGIERALGVESGRQLLVLDLERLDCVLGLGARGCEHGDDRLALPARHVDGEGILRRRAHAREVREHADVGFAHQRDLGAGDDARHARHRRGLLRLDRDDPRVRVRRAQVGDVQHARQHQVVDVLAAPLGEAPRRGPGHRAADVAVRRIEIERLRRFVEFAHFDLPARAFATASIASTIAW